MQARQAPALPGTGCPETSDLEFKKTTTEEEDLEEVDNTIPSAAIIALNSI